MNAAVTFTVEPLPFRSSGAKFVPSQREREGRRRLPRLLVQFVPLTQTLESVGGPGVTAKVSAFDAVAFGLWTVSA